MSDRSTWALFGQEQLPATWWDSWDHLNDGSLDAHPLLSATMVRALVAHFATGKLRFAQLRNGARPVAQTLVQATAAGRWTIFAPSQSPVAPLVFDRSIAGEPRLVHSLLARLSPAALALQVPYQDPTYTLLPANPDSCVEHQMLGNTMAIAAPDGFEQYWSARPRDLRQNVRRYTKRAETNGLPVAFTTTGDPESIGAAVDRFGELESLGWKGKEGTALHPDNAQGRFYREMLTEFATKGRAQAFELHLGDRLAASRLMIESPMMRVMLKTTYAEDLRQYAPGRILLYLSLEKLLSDKSSPRVEFYTRANADMLSWATETRELHSSTIYRFPLLASFSAWRARRRSGSSTSEEKTELAVGNSPAE